MSTIHDWAREWGISPLALADLAGRLGAGVSTKGPSGMSEAGVQSRVRLAAAKQGIRAWRNNLGACYDENGNFIRYGLANDSKQVNERIKSGDLIGIKTVLITPVMVGSFIGQFWSRECKPGDWRYTGTDREIAQKAWAELIVSLGGDAAFTNGSDL